MSDDNYDDDKSLGDNISNNVRGWMGFGKSRANPKPSPKPSPSPSSSPDPDGSGMDTEKVNAARKKMAERMAQ